MPQSVIPARRATPMQYAVMFSGAFERTSTGIVPVEGRYLDAAAYGATIQRANGMQFEVLRRATSDDAWRSLRDESPEQVVARRWTD